MKNLLNKITNLPIQYMLIVAVLSIFMIISMIQGTMSIPFAIGLVVCSILIAMQFYLGGIVVKSIAAIIAVIYLSSIYTSVVMGVYGFIVEPFLLTLAAVTIFVSQTYSKKNIHFNLRSRPLWSTLLAFLLVTFKLSFIITGYSFIVSEFIGLNLLIVYIVLWRFWLNKSKKTKIIAPKVESEETLENIKFIKISAELDAKNSRWKDYKNENAYPYIFSEVIKAAEENLYVVFISTLKTDRVYDVEYIKINKSKSIPYMYIEAKESHYIEEAIEDFIREIKRKEV